MSLRRGILLLCCLLLLAIGAFLAVQLVLPTRLAMPRVVVIAPGASTYAISVQLERAGVIRSSLMFRLLARLRGDAAELQSGEYRFANAADIIEVIGRLRNGDVLLHRLTVPEGLRSDEIFSLLARQTGTSPDIWQQAYKIILGEKEGEGLLLPETYTYRRPLDARRILLDMLRAQNEALKSLLSGTLAAHELRIIASIIEKETAIDAERPLVSAVIHNRLHHRMALQMDPTVIYGLWREDKTFSGNLRKRDLKRDTPWNSYTRKGLPPTPICHPGRASLRAAAHPADVDYLYFVADGSGGHAFAVTLEEHNRNVRHWMRVEKKR